MSLFFFCGHGWGRRGEQLLLLEDVAEDPEKLLQNCVSFADLYAKMVGCRARTQAYFVDACRETPVDLLALNSDCAELIDSSHLIDPTGQHRNAPVVYSTPEGMRASTPKVAEPTAFTRALLETLEGLGADRDHKQRWAVRVNNVGSHLHEVVAWNRGEKGHIQRPSTEGSWVDSAVLRTLAAAPRVPFRVTCEPP